MGDGSMSVKFSKEMASWTWSCVFGCFGFDFEGKQEAIDDFLSHACAMDC
jgi:hypothetical protein